MSGGRRVERLNAQLQREISALLRREVRDPRVAGVTVTRVAITSDLSIARIFVRTLQGDEAIASAIEGLTAAAPFLRRGLAGELHMRRIPELEFREDRSLERAMRIEEILHDVRPDGGWETDGESGEDEPEDA